MKLKLTTTALALNLFANAQTPPTGIPPFPVTVPNNANSSWYRGGNNNTGPAANNNIFGTMFNTPVYHYTNGQNRMILFDDTWNIAGSGPLGSSTPFGGGLALNLNPASPVSRPASLLTISNGNPNFAGGWRDRKSVV